MNSAKSIPFLDTENGDFFLINGLVISSKTTFSTLREQFPTGQRNMNFKLKNCIKNGLQHT